MEKVAVAVFLSQFPAVLFSGSRFLNFADLTVLEPGTNLLHRMRIGRGNTANFVKSLTVFSGRKSLSQGLQSPSNI